MKRERTLDCNRRRISAGMKYAIARGWLLHHIAASGTVYLIKGYIQIRLSDHKRNVPQWKKRAQPTWSINVSKYCWRAVLRAAVAATEWAPRLAFVRTPEAEIRAHFERRRNRRDAAVASKLLNEIARDPTCLVSGAELERQLRSLTNG